MDSEFKPEYCQMLIDHMSKGASYKSFAKAVINVGRQTMYDWEKQHPEWADAKETAFAKNLLFWERVGILLATGKRQGNATAYIYNMSNRFPDDWKNRREHTVTTAIPVFEVKHPDGTIETTKAEQKD